MADDVRTPQVLDVLSAAEPWEVPSAWTERVRAQLKLWADDPEALRPLRPEAFPDFVKGTPAAVWFTHQVAPLLSGWIPVLHGEYADLSTELTHDFYRPPSRLGGNGHVIYAAPTDWHLQAIAGARGFRELGRKHALLVSRDVVRLFVDAPPLAARAEALAAAFERAVNDRDAFHLHITGEYDEIAKYWRTDALTPSERALLPELAGPTAALRYSLNSIRDTHARMLMAVPDEYAGDFAQVLSELILAAGLRGIPQSVANILGDAAVDVHHAFEDLRPRFSLQTWHGHVNQWMSRAIRNGQSPLARAWGAAAARVGVHLSGVLTKQPWPEPEIPDLTTLFRMLDRERWSALETAAAAEQDNSLAAAWSDVKESEQQAATGSSSLDDEPLPPKPVDLSDNPLAELDSLIGLESVKDSVRRMVAEVKTNLRRTELGLPSHERARHMVFVGKPGTAKTTIARLLSRIYHQLGVLEKGHVVEVDRSDLVGAGLGSTAPMTAAKFREALGGVLFIDEAYSLTPENTPGDYGLEAVATILKMMEDHRNDCIVIVAGYHREMQRFMESNTGLQSRFPKLLSFSEYDTDQLVQIFELQARQKGMIYGEEVLDKVRSVIPPAPRGHSFGNGRFIRNVLEEAVSNQATRLSASDPDKLTERDLRELIPSDVRPPTSMRAEDYLLQKPGT
ncbi:AAA family ATPase [Kribbella sp. GL6]|uniref:AAA family ATPase n=1 Tax=Kribbella sp. GL6 TaxID=3419765 RepID=UPI003CFE53F7